MLRGWICRLLFRLGRGGRGVVSWGRNKIGAEDGRQWCQDVRTHIDDVVFRRGLVRRGRGDESRRCRGMQRNGRLFWSGGMVWGFL